MTPKLKNYAFSPEEVALICRQLKIGRDLKFENMGWYSLVQLRKALQSNSDATEYLQYIDSLIEQKEKKLNRGPDAFEIEEKKRERLEYLIGNRAPGCSRAG